MPDPDVNVTIELGRPADRGQTSIWVQRDPDGKLSVHIDDGGCRPCALSVPAARWLLGVAGQTVLHHIMDEGDDDAQDAADRRQDR